MTTEETITFREERGAWVPATPADMVALANYGMRKTFRTWQHAKDACERVGVTFATIQGQNSEHGGSIPRRDVPGLVAIQDEGPMHDNAKAKKRKPMKLKAIHTTREAWLVAAVSHLSPLLADAGTPIKDKVRVSCGWPLGSRKAIGQAFYSEASADKTREIFISPVLDTVRQMKDGVLATLLHELVHCALPKGTMHKQPFANLAKAVGLVRPWTATHASPELCERLKAITGKLGAYPHAAMSKNGGERKKQTTRLLKCECRECGYIVRTTAKWLEIGLPRCTIKAHGEMKLKD